MQKKAGVKQPENDEFHKNVVQAQHKEFEMTVADQRATQKPLKKCLKMFAENAEKKGNCKKPYCEQSGKCLEPGIHEDSTNRTKITGLSNYQTSKSGDKSISLKEFVDLIKEANEATGTSLHKGQA